MSPWPTERGKGDRNPAGRIGRRIEFCLRADIKHSKGRQKRRCICIPHCNCGLPEKNINNSRVFTGPSGVSRRGRESERAAGGSGGETRDKSGLICGAVGCRISHDAPNGRINGRKMMSRPMSTSSANFVKPIMFFDVEQILREISLKIVYGITGRTISADVCSVAIFV